MIMTVAELRQFVTTDGIDPALLEARLADIIKQSQKILSFEPPDIFTKEGEDH